jgi:hypothetical protein
MRVVIAAPRRSGGPLLRCLLGAAYHLAAVGSRDAPERDDLAAIDAWMADLPEQSVTIAGFPFSPELEAIARRHDVRLVAILRHPFDLFLSNHDVAQQQAKRRRGTAENARSWGKLAGLALDDPATLAYARDDFGEDVAWMEGWQASGAPIVRYELLDADPAAVLTGIASHFGPLDSAGIARAIQLCPAENVVVSRPDRGRRMPVLPAEAWREQLPAPVLALLRDRYGAAAARLGYDAGQE